MHIVTACAPAHVRLACLAPQVHMSAELVALLEAIEQNLDLGDLDSELDQSLLAELLAEDGLDPEQFLEATENSVEG